MICFGHNVLLGLKYKNDVTDVSFSKFQFDRSDVISVFKNSMEHSFVSSKCSFFADTCKIDLFQP